MATEKATETSEVNTVNTGTVATIPDTSGWVLVHEEAPDQLKFEEVGEEYVLIYMGQEEIFPPPTPKQIEKNEDPGSFIQLQFRYDRRPIVTNAGYELREAFADIPQCTWVRLKYVKNVDTGEASPMKSFKVWQGPKATDADLSEG
jgi:hypothetical protein